MIRILLKSLIFYFSLTTILFSQIISQIEINGNKRISEATIKVLGEINIATEYNDNELNILIKKLYDTQFFENVSVVIEKNILRINLVENPIVEDIQIQGVKKKSIQETCY